MLGRRSRRDREIESRAWYAGQAMPSAATGGMGDYESFAKTQFTIGMASCSCKAWKGLALRIRLRSQPE
jgi:hypothetical protein